MNIAEPVERGSMSDPSAATRSRASAAGTGLCPRCGYPPWAASPITWSASAPFGIDRAVAPAGSSRNGEETMRREARGEPAETVRRALEYERYRLGDLVGGIGLRVRGHETQLLAGVVWPAGQSNFVTEARPVITGSGRRGSGQSGEANADFQARATCAASDQASP